MSWDFSQVTEPVARKDYHCEASDWILNMIGLDEDEYTPEEWQQIQKAESEKWKILKGQKYVKVKGIWEGDFSVFRARPELNAICLKYDLYAE